MTKAAHAHGFTFIEIIIVVSIIGMLVGVSAIAFSSISQRSRDDRRRIDAESLRDALDKYKSNQPGGYYPLFLDELTAGGYLDKLPVDPMTHLPDVYEYAPTNANLGVCDNVGIFCTDFLLTVNLEANGRYRIDSQAPQGRVISF